MIDGEEKNGSSFEQKVVGAGNGPRSIRKRPHRPLEELSGFKITATANRVGSKDISYHTKYRAQQEVPAALLGDLRIAGRVCGTRYRWKKIQRR